MLRILLASSALVAVAASANAQAVSLSGTARMGLIYEQVDILGTTYSDTVQDNQLNLNFAIAVEGDYGLSFGAITEAEIANGSTGSFSGSQVWVESNGLRLTFGNTDGAIATSGTSHGLGCGVGYVGGHFCGDGAGLTEFGAQGIGLSAIGFLVAGAAQEVDSAGVGAAARARLDYSFGDASVSLSHDRNGSTELGVRATFDAFTVAFGYADHATFTDVANEEGFPYPGSVYTISGHYNAGTWGVGALVARQQYSGASLLNHTNWAISANAEIGGGSLYGYVGRVSYLNFLNFDTAGVSYAYGLGGGANIVGGIERLSAVGTTITTASIGVTFDF